jgi:hypothetical protein
VEVESSREVERRIVVDGGRKIRVRRSKHRTEKTVQIQSQIFREGKERVSGITANWKMLRGKFTFFFRTHRSHKPLEPEHQDLQFHSLPSSSFSRLPPFQLSLTLFDHFPSIPTRNL